MGQENRPLNDRQHSLEFRHPATSPINSQNLWSEYEIETAISLVDRPLRNLKHGDAFAVLDSYGDVGALSGTAEACTIGTRVISPTMNCGSVENDRVFSVP
jgi:hypothetical protein